MINAADESVDSRKDGHHRVMVAVPGPATPNGYRYTHEREESGVRSNGYSDASHSLALLGEMGASPLANGNGHHYAQRRGAGVGDADPRRGDEGRDNTFCGYAMDDGRKGHRERRSPLAGFGFFLENARRFVNTHLSNVAKQQRERSRRMAAANAILFGDDELLEEARGGRSRSLPRAKSSISMRRGPSSLGFVEEGQGGANSLGKNLELVDIEAGNGVGLDLGESAGGDEMAPLLPATEAGDGPGDGVANSGGKTLRRGDRNTATTGDLVRLLHDEQQGAGENSAQEERDRNNAPYAVKPQRSRPFSWSIRSGISAAGRLRQQAGAKRDVEQWKREQWADRSFRVLGVEIGHLPESQQFFVCAGGVFSFLLVYGYMQEYLVVGIFKRHMGLFLTLLQFFGYAACAALQRSMHRRKERKIPLITYSGLGFLQACMQGLTNVSMMYLNYPAKVLFKSSRMVPIMCFGVIWQGRKYTWRDYYVVFLIVTGLATFMNAETRATETSETPFSLLGVACISLALMIDAAIINIQEEVMNRYDSCQDELIMFSYLCGTVYLSLACLFTGDLRQGITFLHGKGLCAILAVMLFAGAGYLGVSCVAALTKRFGALHSAITTTARKALTLMLSFVVFPNKPFSVQHGVGAAVFILGLVTKATGKKPRSGAPAGPASSTSPGATPFMRLRSRKRLAPTKESCESLDGSSSAAPLISGTSGGSSCNGSGHGGGSGGGDSDRIHALAPDDRHGSAPLPSHSGGYPVRHRGIPKNGGNGHGEGSSNSEGSVRRGAWGQRPRASEAREPSPQPRSPLRRLFSPPVSGLGAKLQAV